MGKPERTHLVCLGAGVDVVTRFKDDCVLQRRRGAPYGTVSGTHIAERIPARVKRQLKDATFLDRNIHQQARIAQRDRT